MIRTVVGGKMSFDRIAEELVNQHPRIHEKAAFGCGQFRRNDYNGYQRPGIPKGRPRQRIPTPRKPRYHAAFCAEEDEMLSYPDVRDEHYHEDNHDGATEDYQRPTARPTHEACDFASEVIQAEQEAYFARKGAQTKKGLGFRVDLFG